MGRTKAPHFFVLILSFNNGHYVLIIIMKFATNQFFVKFFLILLLIFPSLGFCSEGEVQDAKTKYNIGFNQIKQNDGGFLSIFYPTYDKEAIVKKGIFNLSIANDAKPEKGNSHLIIISHGSGGSPWVHYDLAHRLVESGFIVALPQHYNDNYINHSEPGPKSWRRRPKEVSNAIDLLALNKEFSPLIDFNSIGIFGGSAGGHTALSMAGGKWSETNFRDYCLKNIKEDFSSCVGFSTILKKNIADNFKLALAKTIIKQNFSNRTIQEDSDKRIKASIAMVPFAADFIPQSLKQPKVPLGIIIARKDINQKPEFHVLAIAKACDTNCEIILDMQEAGHGAMLSPLPSFRKNSIEDLLLSDPKSFDREKMIPIINNKIVDFFERHLLKNDAN